MEISIAQNVAGKIQELLQISCIFFANWFAFFCIIFAFFCILIFGGPFFSCICFAFFCIYIFFYVSQEEAAARPHNIRLCSSGDALLGPATASVVSLCGVPLVSGS